MNAKKVDYPAKLVGYRIDVVNDRIVLFEDIPVLFNDRELERRIGTYRALDAAGGIPYTFQLFSLEDLDAGKANIQADLEQQLAQVKGWWQERKKREPEPVPDYWADAVLDATQLARVYFMEQGNKAALKRLPRAQSIAALQNWRKVGDKADTWLMPSSTGSGKVYMVNGRCSCPDTVAWCKHRIARALAKRAEAILKEDNADAPAETEVSNQPHLSTTPLNGDTRRIDLILAYEADDAKALPRINGNGQLVRFEADGEEVAPPTQSISDLYRWLQARGYVPKGFKWLGWEHGLRHRRQSYVREAAA